MINALEIVPDICEELYPIEEIKDDTKFVEENDVLSCVINRGHSVFGTKNIKSWDSFNLFF